MNANFYFVRTPLQYLNAVEARQTKKFSQSAQHLIILSDFHRTISQIEAIIHPNLWTSISYPWKEFVSKKNLPIFNLFYIFNRKLKIDKILLTIENKDFIFWGNINSNWFFYLFYKKKSNFYILDDGFASIDFIHNSDVQAIKSSLLSSKLGKIERIVLRLNYKINWERIHFFTNFDLQQSSKNLELHSYDYLSKQFKIGTLSKIVYFVGQPLVFQKMMSKENYIKLINSIFNYYNSQNYTCYYLPHRSTTLDYIPKNWLTKSFNKPLECILFDEQIEKPIIFASFYSSALYNIAIMDKNLIFKYDYWQFDESYLINFPIKKILNVYDFVKNLSNKNNRFLNTSNINE